MKRLITSRFSNLISNFKFVSLNKFTFTNQNDQIDKSNQNIQNNQNEKKFKIYTKTGDKGTTSLIGGTRKNKDDEIFEILGDIDELNSYIGLCCSNINPKQELHNSLVDIQNHLYHISAFIASLEKEKYLKDPKYEEKLEKLIDKMEEELPPLKNFINPGGCLGGAHLQVARSIARRVERRYLTYSRERSDTYVKFFNRLSDFLFVASRFENHMNNLDETLAK